MTVKTAESIITSVIDEISEFDKECKDAEYTDTDKAWTLFNSIKADLGEALNGGAGMSDTRHLVTNVGDLSAYRDGEEMFINLYPENQGLSYTVINVPVGKSLDLYNALGRALGLR